jgi:hypothetical protein
MRQALERDMNAPDEGHEPVGSPRVPAWSKYEAIRVWRETIERLERSFEHGR